MGEDCGSGESQTLKSEQNEGANDVSLGMPPLWMWCFILMSRSHQNLCLVLTMKLLGIVLRNRCWPIIFHTVTSGDVDGWCQN